MFAVALGGRLELSQRDPFA